MRRRSYGSISVNVDVDVDIDSVMEDICDDDLIEECRRRHLGGSFNSPTPFVRDYLELAYDALLRGRRDEALALLDRMMFPTGAEKMPDGQLVFKATP
jgi:hypothetical protein